MPKKILATASSLLAFILCFVLLSALFLPHLTEQRLSRNFRHYLNASSVSADVGSKNIISLLQGHTETINIKIEAGEKSILNISSLEASWNKSNVVLNLLSGPRLYIRDAEANNTVIYWNNQTLAAYLNQTQNVITNISLVIGEENIAVSGRTKDGNISFNAIPKIDDYLSFELTELSLNGVSQTEEELKPYQTALTLDIKLTPLKWKIWVRQVILSEGQMKLVGSSSCCH